MLLLALQTAACHVCSCVCLLCFCLSVCLSLSDCPSVCMSVCLSVCLHACPHFRRMRWRRLRKLARKVSLMYVRAYCCFISMVDSAGESEPANEFAALKMRFAQQITVFLGRGNQTWEITSCSNNCISSISDISGLIILRPQSTCRILFVSSRLLPLDHRPLDHRPHYYRPHYYRPLDYKPPDHRPLDYRP